MLAHLIAYEMHRLTQLGFYCQGLPITADGIRLVAYGCNFTHQALNVFLTNVTDSQILQTWSTFRAELNFRK